MGLTGGIGSGKSLALSEFKRRGAVTISSDEIAHDQARPGKPAHRAMLRAFETADRGELSSLIFRSPAARKKLESLTHPLILRELKRRISRSKGVVVADVPLLFEKGLASEFDVTLLVTAPESARLKRLKARNLPPGEARRRMKAQLPDSAKAAKSDVVVANAGTKKEFLRRVGQYHEALALMQESPQ